MASKHKFAILGVNATSWDGSPTTLTVSQSVTMSQTTNGSMVFAYQNKATQNNAGQLALTSGGSQPQFLPVPALANQPSILIQNWKANNLNATNTSANASTPIWIEAFGPGLPGQQPVALPVGGAAITLTTTQTAQANASPNWMQLKLTSNTSNLSILALVGGPTDSSGNNAYVIALNASAETGPGGATPPTGYYATTTGNAYAFPFNWGSSTINVANMSPSTAAAVSVQLISL
jgi:hypothetical protein